jgi:hypothetical protein
MFATLLGINKVPVKEQWSKALSLIVVKLTLVGSVKCPVKPVHCIKAAVPIDSTFLRSNAPVSAVHCENARYPICFNVLGKLIVPAKLVFVANAESSIPVTT